jgi:hypothetical protein
LLLHRDTAANPGGKYWSRPVCLDTRCAFPHELVVTADMSLLFHELSEGKRGNMPLLMSEGRSQRARPNALRTDCCLDAATISTTTTKQPQSLWRCSTNTLVPQTRKTATHNESNGRSAHTQRPLHSTQTTGRRHALSIRMSLC